MNSDDCLKKWRLSIHEMLIAGNNMPVKSSLPLNILSHYMKILNGITLIFTLNKFIRILPANFFLSKYEITYNQLLTVYRYFIENLGTGVKIVCRMNEYVWSSTRGYSTTCGMFILDLTVSSGLQFRGKG